jgi:hypothetical protein
MCAAARHSEPAPTVAKQRGVVSDRTRHDHQTRDRCSEARAPGSRRGGSVVRRYDPWIVIVEPDAEARLLVVVTAYEVSE